MIPLYRMNPPLSEPTAETTTLDEPTTQAETTTLDEPTTQAETTTLDEPTTQAETTTLDEPTTQAETTTLDEPTTQAETTTLDEPTTQAETTTLDEPTTQAETTTLDEPTTQAETTTLDEPTPVSQTQPEPVVHTSIAHELVFLGEVETKLILHENESELLLLGKVMSNGNLQVKPEIKIQLAPESVQQPAPEPQSESIASDTLEIQPQPVPDIIQPISEPTPPSEHTKDGAPLAYLIITAPDTGEQHEVPLEHEETTLGRAGSSDILLTQDTQTSRHHALLKQEGGSYILYDQRSEHGVFVNGQKLTGEIGHVLSDGDHINIGEYKLLFCLN